MPMLPRPDAEIWYEEFGNPDGFPVFLFAPGGIRSRIEMWHHPKDGPKRPWNDWTEVLAGRYRVVSMDQRNAGRSRGEIRAGYGWHTYLDDQLAVMDHLKLERMHVLGGCVGVSFCLLHCRDNRARIQSAVLQNPIGLNAEFPSELPAEFDSWTDELLAERPDHDREEILAFGRATRQGDFVYSVDRDFCRRCDVPCLVLPGNDRPHPRPIGLELAGLLPGAELLVDWKGPDHMEIQRETVTDFLARHTP